MFWFPCEQPLVKYANISQIQLVQLTLEQNQQSGQRKYAELFQYCRSLERENQRLKSELNCLQEQVKPRRTRKIKRRVQSELEKNFQCLYPNCKKQYASELALNLHMKIKHNAGSKRERVNAANRIMRAAAEGLEQPKLKINLPPNYVQTLQHQNGPLRTPKLGSSEMPSHQEQHQ